jgi:hypothetical protein
MKIVNKLREGYYRTKEKLVAKHGPHKGQLLMIEAEIEVLRNAIIEDRTSLNEITEAENSKYNNLLSR